MPSQKGQGMLFLIEDIVGENAVEVRMIFLAVSF